MPSTLTIQAVVNFASTQTELMPLAGVGGYTSEPALSIANDTLQELLKRPHPWKHNRIEMPMVALRRGKQTIQFAGASAFTLTDAKGAAIGLAASSAITETINTVLVNTLEPHGLVAGDVVYMTGNTVAAYNSTFTQTSDSSAWSGGWTVLTTPSTTSFTFTHASSGLSPSGAPGITDFGWLESATLVDTSNVSSPQPVKPVTAVRQIQPSSTVQTPLAVAVIQDLGTGVLRIRFDKAPGAIPYVANLVYQAKAPLLSSLASTWAPFPDEFGFVIRQMFLALAYRFANSQRSEVEYAKAQANIMKALGGDDLEDSNENIVPSSPIETFGISSGGWF